MAAPRRSTRSRHHLQAEEPAVSPTRPPAQSPPRKRKRSVQAEDGAGDGPSCQPCSAAPAAAARAASPTPPPRRNGKLVKLKRPVRGAAAAAALAADGDQQQAAEATKDAEGAATHTSGPHHPPAHARIKASASKALSPPPIPRQATKTPEDYLLPREQELWLQSVDAEKLRTVAKHVIPELLEVPLPPESNFAKQFAGAKGKSKEKLRPSSTLAQALDGRMVSLRQLRAFALTLREPLLAPVFGEDGGSIQAQASEALTSKKLKGLNLLLGIIDEIAIRSRAQDRALAASIASAAVATTRSTKDVKVNGHEKGLSDDLEALLTGDVSRSEETADKGYALHMRLATGDYFTKAVKLTSQRASKLDTGLADLVAIESLPAASSTSSSAKPLLLGERIHRDVSLRVPRETIEELREKRLPKLKGIQHLYYGPYASFAPTYDSSASSLSKAATSLVWRGKLAPKVRGAKSAWYDVSEDEEEGVEVADEEESNIPPPSPAPVDTKQSTLPDNLDPTLDSDLIRAGLNQLDRDASVHQQLETNALLLTKLQEYQWDRLRRGYARSKILESSTGVGHRGSIGELPEDEPSNEERAVAAGLHKGLAALVALRPRSTTSLLPTQHQLRALSHSSAIDPIFGGPSAVAKSSSGYWGTFDPSLYSPDAPVRLAGKVSTIVPTFISTDTVRLDDSGESLAHSNAMSKRGVPLGVARDSGKGMLDRLATIADVNRGFAADKYGPGSKRGYQPTKATPAGASPPAAMGMSPPAQQLHNPRQVMMTAPHHQTRSKGGGGTTSYPTAAAGSSPLISNSASSPPPNGHLYTLHSSSRPTNVHRASLHGSLGAGEPTSSPPPAHAAGAAGAGWQNVNGAPRSSLVGAATSGPLGRGGR